MNNELYLIYINYIGQNFLGTNIYEFLFSDRKDINGENWDEFPANGKPLPPSKNDVVCFGILYTNLIFELVQNSQSFSMWDAVDGIIALGWENITDYDEYPENRLYFTFGESYQSVVDKLYSKDIELKIIKT